MELVFEWEPRKDQANLKKHGITFTEATSVFGDRLARIFADEVTLPRSSARSLSVIRGRSDSCWFVSPNARNRKSGSSAPGVQPGGNSAIMKNTSRPKSKPTRSDGLRPEYRFDYTKAKPNRFAGRVRTGSLAVLLDPDVAQVFQDAESVNTVLRALMTTMPDRRVRETR